MESLKNGVVLCEAMNVVKPGAIRRINASRMPFKQMENISNFLSACRQLGMSEYDLFTTVALFEAKDRNAVINGIVAFGRLAQKIGFRGPTIGVKESSKNTRHFTKEQLSRSNGQVSKLNMGGYGIQERSAMDTSRNITFGAQKRALLFHPLAFPSSTWDLLASWIVGPLTRAAILPLAPKRLAKRTAASQSSTWDLLASWIVGPSTPAATSPLAPKRLAKRTAASPNSIWGLLESWIVGPSTPAATSPLAPKSSGAAAPSTGVNKWNQGSSSTMQRGGIDRTRDINFGANAGRR